MTEHDGVEYTHPACCLAPSYEVYTPNVDVYQIVLKQFVNPLVASLATQEPIYVVRQYETKSKVRNLVRIRNHYHRPHDGAPDLAVGSHTKDT